ncbi:TetR/AcrR family transcriptional regulator [Aneurinibacillus migulanus]|uniref:TetR family transcriptional regulator n=1 Tax=Aneurinibacillus migulanus TaxID=47500 RepID=A0A0D1VE86_ANEMI|nr:TetR/AcrR family transcriptional regulator [Aneurinibacillus migulanus]KIV57759.1 TetR family transcriptional regulator [Aneurinibacillus migulanus]KON97145.1 TetR family transcriptional regulator [Aneurinibacillus migulanus]MED0896420.1 TetR/AcrR family transcriptional regulator [Aneurinibacillus migulanus]MED1616079.1 TetR/AcrR family transcriptional regulator [Aneurinibacillus migulanus]SDJ96546.1 transcriptional regulator, TetR family [Aneurinibacillus migulanus]
MVRRRLTQEERKQETRQMLLESAAETFAQLGFHGASVDKIAEFAGFSKGAVYAHFKSKEELFLALLKQQIQSHIDLINEMWGEYQSFDRFIENMNDYFCLVRQKSRAWSILSMEFLLYAMRNESVHQKWTTLILESVEKISKIIEKMMLETGYESALSAEELAWTILSLENGMAIFYYITEDNIPPNLYGKALKKMLYPH